MKALSYSQRGGFVDIDLPGVEAPPAYPEKGKTELEMMDEWQKRFDLSLIDQDGGRNYRYLNRGKVLDIYAPRKDDDLSAIGGWNFLGILHDDCDMSEVIVVNGWADLLALRIAIAPLIAADAGLEISDISRELACNARKGEEPTIRDLLEEVRDSAAEAARRLAS